MKTLFVNFLYLLLFTALFLGACSDDDKDGDKDTFEDVADSLNLTIIDFDTHRPVPDVEVFITTTHFGNATINMSNLTVVGKSDNCGRVTGPAPKDRARYTVHAEMDTTHFVLLFKAPGYGEFYDFVEIGEDNKEIEAQLPFVYNLTTVTDRSAPSVRLDWSLRRSAMRFYDANGSTNFLAAGKFHLWRQTLNSPAPTYREIFSEDYDNGHNGTFTDHTVHPHSTYRYSLFPYDDISRSAGQTDVTIDMKTSGTTTWLPRPTACD